MFGGGPGLNLKPGLNLEQHSVVLEKAPLLFLNLEL